MKKVINFLNKVVSDGNSISSKRVVGVVGAGVLFGTLIANSFSPLEIAPSAELVAAVEWVTILCLGFTSVEKFSKKD